MNPVATGQREFAQPAWNRTTWWWLMVLALVLGAVLRLAWIDNRSLWFDEAFTVLLSEKTLDEIWTFPTTPGSDPHPRGFKTFLHYWIDAFGRSELAVRLPTAFASILNLALLGLLARRLFGRATALMAIVLLALAPLDIWYAQEVRMYMWVTTFGLLFAVMLTVDGWLALPGLLLAFTLGLYIDIPMLPLAVGLCALWLAHWWQGRREVRPLIVVLAALIGSWLLLLPIMTYYTFTFGELNRIFVIREFRTALGLPAFAPWQYVLALVGIALLLTAAALIGKRLLERPGFRRWFGLLVFVGFAALTLAMPIPRLYGIKRVVLTGWPYVVLFVAWLITADWGRGRRAFLALAGLSLAASLVTVIAVPKDDWRGAVNYISQTGQSVDTVWIDPAWNTAAYAYYQPDARIRSGSLERLSMQADNDIWLVAERFPDLPTPSSPSEAWLDEHMILTERAPFYRLEVRHYEPLP